LKEVFAKAFKLNPEEITSRLSIDSDGTARYELKASIPESSRFLRGNQAQDYSMTILFKPNERSTAYISCHIQHGSRDSHDVNEFAVPVSHLQSKTMIQSVFQRL
jgi:hypothetical protein